MVIFSKNTEFNLENYKLLYFNYYYIYYLKRNIAALYSAFLLSYNYRKIIRLIKPNITTRICSYQLRNRRGFGCK